MQPLLQERIKWELWNAYVYKYTDVQTNPHSLMEDVKDTKRVV